MRLPSTGDKNCDVMQSDSTNVLKLVEMCIVCLFDDAMTGLVCKA